MRVTRRDFLRYGLVMGALALTDIVVGRAARAIKPGEQPDELADLPEEGWGVPWGIPWSVGEVPQPKKVYIPIVTRGSDAR
jgi:hypothetical protein